MNSGIKTTLIAALGGVIGSILGPCVQHVLTHRPEVVAVDFAPQIVHVGDESRPDYPDHPDGRRLEYKYARLLPRKPSQGIILLDAYDVDLIGAEVFFNDVRLGQLKTGDDWQENTFPVCHKQFSKEQNVITIRSRVRDNGQAEDFLIKNLRMQLRYR